MKKILAIISISFLSIGCSSLSEKEPTAQEFCKTFNSKELNEEHALNVKSNGVSISIIESCEVHGTLDPKPIYKLALSFVNPTSQTQNCKWAYQNTELVDKKEGFYLNDMSLTPETTFFGVAYRRPDYKFFLDCKVSDGI